MSRYFKPSRKGSASFLGLGIGVSAMVVCVAALMAALAVPSTGIADPPLPGGIEEVHPPPPPWTPPSDIEAWYQYLRDLLGM